MLLKASSTIALLVGIAGLACASLAQAEERLWAMPTSGAFNDASRWTGGIAPIPTDLIRFGLVGGNVDFNVAFAADAQHAGLTVDVQRPVFLLGGHTLSIAGDTRIGGTGSTSDGEPLGWLALDGGGILDNVAGDGRIVIGDNDGEWGRLEVGAGVTVRGVSWVGNAGDGDLWLQPGSKLDQGPSGESIVLGGEIHAYGTLGLDAAELIAPNCVFISGLRGRSWASSTGSQVSTRQTFFGLESTGKSDILVSGGGTWTSSEYARIGSNGSAKLTLNDGAQFLAPEIIIAQGNGSHGDVTVDGLGTLIRGLNHVGWGGNATLTITNGGVVSAFNSAANRNNDGRVGEGSGTTSSVTIDGPGSAWKDLGSTYVGGIYHSDTTGRGSITVQNGGRLEGTTFVLGSRGPAQGEILVTGTGSVMDAGFINVGAQNGTSSNQCSLTVSNGGTINTAGVVLYPKGLMAGSGAVTDTNPTDGSPALYAISGVVSPGTTSAPIGTLTFNSPAQGVWLRDVKQAVYPPPTLAIDLAGTGAGQFDRIATTGLAELGGGLAITRLNGYVPALGSSFPIVSSTGLAGEFASVSGAVLQNGNVLVPVLSPTGLTLICSEYVGLSITPSPITANLGFPVKLSAMGSFTPAGLAAVNSLGPTWSSDNVGVATVDGAGLLIGQSVGTTTARTQWNGRAAAAAVNVLPLPANLTTDLVSRNSGGMVGNGYSNGAVLSADGSTAVFLSSATNLVPGDANGTWDVFVRDLNTGTINLVAPAMGGGSANGSASSPTCSADGRLVAFSSAATNLVIGDTNGVTDVFVFDRETGITERVSLATDGSQADGVSSSPMISRDGRRVVFQSLATNLVSHDTNAATDIFVHDRVTKVTERVSVAANGDQANSLSLLPTFSPDGSLVLFRTSANNLFANDNNAVPDLVLKNISTGTVEPVTVASDGTLANSAGSSAYYHAISADNRFVCFQSFANNLVPGDTNNVGDIFLRDRVAGTTRRINITENGAQTFGGSGSGSISDNGRFAFFSSGANDLVPGDTNGTTDLFRVDLRTGRVIRISDNHFGEQANSSSTQPMCSAGGTIVGFRTDASNLGPFDNNSTSDAVITRLTIPCDADFDGDGFLSFEDFDAFVVAFELGEPDADFDGDGFLSFEDFDAFVAAFEAGC